MKLRRRNEAAEVFAGSSGSPVLLTCEHASEQLPGDLAWPEPDRRLLGTHWAVDLGARELAMSLAERLDSIVVLSRLSRLLVDVNRPEDSDTLFRGHAEGAPVLLNTGITERERAARIRRFSRPYHEMVDEEVRASEAELLFSVHSFTPNYEGERRTLEIGVLFHEDEGIAASIEAGLRRAGYRTALNEPYSGTAGLMYSVDRHARAHGRKAVELEVRQDLAVDPGFRTRLVDLLAVLLTP